MNGSPHGLTFGLAELLSAIGAKLCAGFNFVAAVGTETGSGLFFLAFVGVMFFLAYRLVGRSSAEDRYFR